MRLSTLAGVATLALICSVSIGSLAAVAQTGGLPSGTSQGGGAAPPTIVTPQGQINTAPDETNAFLKSLEGLVNQTIPGFLPSLGAPVPQDMQLKPLPPQAKAAIPPQAKTAMPQIDDHHVAKFDDNTILIIDPVTRQVVGMISTSGDSSLAIDGSQKGQNQPQWQPGQGLQPGQSMQPGQEPQGQSAPQQPSK